MRVFAVAMLAVLGFFITNDTARAEQATSCKLCRDQQRACMSNYPAKTCKIEYDMCMKSCRKK